MSIDKWKIPSEQRFQTVLVTFNALWRLPGIPFTMSVPPPSDYTCCQILPKTAHTVWLNRPKIILKVHFFCEFGLWRKENQKIDPLTAFSILFLFYLTLLVLFYLLLEILKNFVYCVRLTETCPITYILLLFCWFAFWLKKQNKQCAI